ncbi:MAG TPA: sigma-70 family RNA polymerase sigma factor [Nocardioides sp.]|uniref:RNA polymerase sigma factor n=1 Tax=Actinomycetes TaxID=1760 RepID=UPI002B5E3551|nr:sigma-70 family RNA polymerase sigma factor [Flexivirga sp.]HWC23067.1 sigma-70 family RNA polymerase sigma factor [Flexivirga sp.]
MDRADTRDVEARARFEETVREILEPLRRFLARRTDAATADDVLAETLLVCWRRYDELPARSLPFAYGVARLCLANAARGARRQRRLAGRIATLEPPREAPEPIGDDRLAEAMAGLSPEDGELLRLWAWEQLTPGEIATVLDITPNAASIRLYRAKDRLRTELRKIDAADGHEETTEGGRR